MIAGLDGPCVVISAETAKWLEVHGSLRTLRQRVRGRPEREQVLKELLEVGAVAELYREVLPALPEVRAGSPEVAAESEQWLSPGQVADRLGLTDRAVRLACSEGRIAGARLVGRRWQITPDGFERFRRERAA